MEIGYILYSLTQRTGSTPRSLTLRRLTQPLPACSVVNYTDGQVGQYTADRAGRGWVSLLNVRRRAGGRGLSSVRSQSDTSIYSNWSDLSLASQLGRKRKVQMRER